MSGAKRVTRLTRHRLILCSGGGSALLQLALSRPRTNDINAMSNTEQVLVQVLLLGRDHLL